MDSLLDPLPGAEHREMGGASIDVIRAGNVRVRRVVYPPGFRWSRNMKALVGTNHCMHVHVGFLARGHVQGEYADGCRFELVAPVGVLILPGHDAWVVGDEAAVLIEVDAEGETASRFGLPSEHRHS